MWQWLYTDISVCLYLCDSSHVWVAVIWRIVCVWQWSDGVSSIYVCETVIMWSLLCAYMWQQFWRWWQQWSDSPNPPQRFWKWRRGFCQTWPSCATTTRTTGGELPHVHCSSPHQVHSQCLASMVHGFLYRLTSVMQQSNAQPSLSSDWLRNLKQQCVA